MADFSASWTQNLFAYEGRTKRLDFAAKICLSILVGLFAFVIAGGNLQAMVIASCIGILLLMTTYVRRLYDLNMSGHWVLVFLIFPLLVVVTPIAELILILDWPNSPGMAPGDGSDFGTALFTAFAGLMCLPIIAGSFLVFLLLPSQTGYNRYGPDPREVRQEPIARPKDQPEG